MNTKFWKSKLFCTLLLSAKLSKLLSKFYFWGKKSSTSLLRTEMVCNFIFYALNQQHKRRIGRFKSFTSYRNTEMLKFLCFEAKTLVFILFHCDSMLQLYNNHPCLHINEDMLIDWKMVFLMEKYDLNLIELLIYILIEFDFESLLLVHYLRSHRWSFFGLG